MMVQNGAPDAHERPPESIRQIFKQYQKLKSSLDLDLDADIVDPFKLFETGDHASQWLHRTVHQNYQDAFTAFTHPSEGPHGQHVKYDAAAAQAYESRVLPGLLVFPALLPPHVQLSLLDRLFHRDLSDASHRTNVHLHHHVKYPSSHEDEPKASAENIPPTSFFALDPSQVLLPKDSSLHKAITIKDFLGKKLRWITLGGQYNWTSKSYPSEVPPAFPVDIRQLLQGLFPDMEAQAAIVNLYSPGDTLSVHRDVSEDCDRGLVSVSLGCDGIFLICDSRGQDVLVLRLRSGDAVYMTRQARFAWHAVPKIVAGTCPEWLQSWPADGTQCQLGIWRGWMSTKRINLNVRQMVDEGSADKSDIGSPSATVEQCTS